MSLPKKGSRKINVENITYLWKVKSNGERINLTIAPLKNGQKILSSFDFDTENIGSNAFNFPFVITPYVTREVILFALENGYSSNEKSKEMNLGNLTKKIKLNLSGARNTKKLVKEIGKRIDNKNLDSIGKKQIQSILKEMDHFIQHGEWFVGFEIMIENFYEMNFKVKENELILIKEIFQKAKVDWEKDWNWIDELKEDLPS
ncbi:MAG: hypothetical protein AB8H03_16995 [Saprospiraceae bacterium]